MSGKPVLGVASSCIHQGSVLWPRVREDQLSSQSCGTPTDASLHADVLRPIG